MSGMRCSAAAGSRPTVPEIGSSLILAVIVGVMNVAIYVLIRGTARVRLLFLVPGRGETLRVNGRASIVRDAEVLARLAVAGKTPRLAIGVEVEEVFLHCAKAFKRSSLWRPEAWPDISALPSAACMLLAHARPDGMTLEQMEQRLRHSYDTTLY